MKTMLRPLLLVALLLGALAAPARASADACTAARLADAARLQAVTAPDADAVARAMTDDCLYVHASGIAQTKAEFIAALAGGAFRYHVVRYTSTNLRAYGDSTVVMTGRATLDVENQAGRRSLDVLFTSIYVDTGGSWKLASYQSTAAPAAAK